MCRMNRHYSNIKAKVWRNDAGFVCCELLTVYGDFILSMISADKAETEHDAVQTALRCLSARDLALAGNGAMTP